MIKFSKIQRCKLMAFSMIEMIFALGLLMLLSVCIMMSLHTLRKMDMSFTKENRALLALDNTLERLEAMKRYNAQEVKDTFKHEWDEMGLKTEGEIVPVYSRKDEFSVLSLMKKNGKSLIEVKIKCPQK